MFALLVVHPGFELAERRAGQHVEDNIGRASFETRAQPVTRRVEYHRTTHAKVRPEHRALEAYQRVTLRSHRHGDGMRHARKRRMQRISQDERCKRWRRLDVAVTERPREQISAAIAARLRERTAAGREHHGTRVERPAVLRGHGETVPGALNT